MTRRALIPATMLSFAWPRAAWAGMPSLHLTELGELRLQTISFFLMGLLVSAAVVYGVWNWLRRDFVRLPKLSYFKACAVVVLWGLLFVVVLTMISGARELMTPGAWEKNGLTYKLKGDTTKPSESAQPAAANAQSAVAAREARITRLALQLDQFAAKHDHRFPAANETGEIAEEFWRTDSHADIRYIYVPGQNQQAGSAPLAYEPQIVGEPIFVLFTDGKIERLPFSALVSRLPREPNQ